MDLRCNHFRFHVSHLVRSFHGVWCSFQGWDVGTLGNTLSGCVTQDQRVGPSEACAIHPIHPVHLVVCMIEISEGFKEPVGQPKIDC